MIKVPKNKVIYVGRAKFVEGEALPPYVMVEMPVLTKSQADKLNFGDDEPKRKRGRPKKFVM